MERPVGLRSGLESENMPLSYRISGALASPPGGGGNGPAFKVKAIATKMATQVCRPFPYPFPGWGSGTGTGTCTCTGGVESEVSMHGARMNRTGMVLATLIAAAGGSSAGEPLRLHPENPHYFLFRGKPAVLVTSGEHYGAVLNLDFDYAAYLDQLRDDGLNHTRTWLGTYRELPGTFGITDNTLAPFEKRYACPWARSSTPGYFHGGNKFDLTRWDEAFFARLRDFLSRASRCGVVVELNLFCPNYEESLWQASPLNATNNVNGIGNCKRDETYTTKHPDLLGAQEAVVRKVVGELRDFDNLYYEICNEPYFGGVTLEWQHFIAGVIADAEKDFPAKHLISQNVANGSAKVEKPHPAISIFNF